MALYIKNPEAGRLARELARRQNMSITDTIINALQAELAREERRVPPTGLAERVKAISRRYSGLPTLDGRSADDILGYDDSGLLN